MGAFNGLRWFFKARNSLLEQKKRHLALCTNLRVEGDTTRGPHTLWLAPLLSKKNRGDWYISQWVDDRLSKCKRAKKSYILCTSLRDVDKRLLRTWSKFSSRNDPRDTACVVAQECDASCSLPNKVTTMRFLFQFVSSEPLDAKMLLLGLTRRVDRV